LIDLGCWMETELRMGRDAEREADFFGFVRHGRREVQFFVGRGEALVLEEPAVALIAIHDLFWQDRHCGLASPQ